MATIDATGPAPSKPPDAAVKIIVLGSSLDGESVLIHVGDGRWVIVDSFKGRWPGDSDTGVAPLLCLKKMGVRPTKVSAVVLTHLHIDHCNGIDEVATDCTDAWVCFPTALSDQRWELILEQLKDEATGTRRTRMQSVASAYEIAQQGERFAEVGSLTMIPRVSDKLHALAPTMVGRQAARRPFIELHPQEATRLKHENATSIVLWLDVDGARALLGGDMENLGPLGWQAVLGEHRDRNLGKATYVKVAHHGSEGAYDPAVFEHWTADPIGVITPNRRGTNDLPRLEDLGDLKAVTRELWLAGVPNPPPMAGPAATTGTGEIRWVAATFNQGLGRFELDPEPPAGQKL